MNERPIAVPFNCCTVRDGPFPIPSPDVLAWTRREVGAFFSFNMVTMLAKETNTTQLFCIGVGGSGGCIRVNRPALGGTVPNSTAMSRRPALLTPCPAFIDHPVLGGTSRFQV